MVVSPQRINNLADLLSFFAAFAAKVNSHCQRAAFFPTASRAFDRCMPILDNIERYII
jgi:hypothetical protein